MPVLSGIDATQKIRSYEKELCRGLSLSPSEARYRRIAIIAVSASLSEQFVDEYISAGFDGWVMKPIDYKRLEVIMTAVKDEQLKRLLIYSPGDWTSGGCFRTQIHESEA